MKTNLFVSLRLFAVILGCVALLLTDPVRSEVKLPAIISEHMVLQTDAVVPIWGWGTPGESVVVTLGNVTARTAVESDGRWTVELPKLTAGGPLTLKVSGTNELVVKDVLVGEVWLGSGQSNMAMAVNRAHDFERESATADFPNIRMFTVTSTAADKPQADCRGAWTVCTPQAVAQYSATAYFFGRELHRQLNVPVGLINSSVGGTPIESWISADAQANATELKPVMELAAKSDAAFDTAKAKAKYDRDLTVWQDAAKRAKAAGKSAPRRPQDPIAVRERKGNIGGLFNGKIAPLIPYRIRGALWYQGEANSTPEKAPYYQFQLPLLIQDWRSRWGHEFPVAWVQLPNFRGAGRDWPTIRQAMLQTLQVPNTGMAITLDIGDPDDIHPKNKQEVGRRLAKWALGTVYGKPVAISGPIPIGQQRQGNALVIQFRHADEGLRVKGSELSGFEIADVTGFKPANARINGDQVVLTHPSISEPTAARYAWENNPRATLYNGAGLPASPFRVSVKP